MPAEVMDRWLSSRQSAQIAGIWLKPKRHDLLRDTPVSIRRGQAEVYLLLGPDGSYWFLKKFHRSMALEPSYLQKVSVVLPTHDCFRSGTDRRVLQAYDLQSQPQCFRQGDLRRWIDGTLLMPRTPGLDWATVADEIRAGRVVLNEERRLSLCQHLVGLVQTLEQNDCAHRDLSSGNVFVDQNYWSLSLIDFDSLYHPSLTMPRATTCGTEGYIPPFAWQNSHPNPHRTWCREADRFALALLNTEFLTLGCGDSLTGEGGLFSQEELRARRGPCLTSTRQTLQARWPQVLPLLDAAIAASAADQCPSPADWAHAVGCRLPTRVPDLTEMESVLTEHFANILSRRVAAKPLHRVPSLAEMPDADMKIPAKMVVVVRLMSDPWKP